MNYSNSQRAGVILYLAASLFGGYKLSRYEYGVLVFLAQRPGWLCSKEQIFENVWHEDSESSLVAIANTISRIRQKIEPDKDHPIYIQTVSSLGYIFAAKPL